MSVREGLPIRRDNEEQGRNQWLVAGSSVAAFMLGCLCGWLLPQLGNKEKSARADDEIVEQFRLKIRRGSLQSDVIDHFGQPHKMDFMSSIEANREFSSVSRSPADEKVVSITRYCPFESVGGPAYRINVVILHDRKDGQPLLVHDYYIRSQWFQA